MKVSEFNQTMAYLLRPQPRQTLAIGGGVVEGEDLGSREGFAKIKKKITLTKEILEDILNENPGSDYDTIVKILNKGNYVTPKIGGRGGEVVGGGPGGNKFTNTILAYHAKKFGLEGKILKRSATKSFFDNLSKVEQKNISGYLEDLVKSKGKATVGGVAKGKNFFSFIRQAIIKANRNNPSQYPFDADQIEKYNGKQIFDAIRFNRGDATLLKDGKVKIPKESDLFQNLRRAAATWGETEGKGLVGFKKLFDRLGKKNGYGIGAIKQYISIYDKKPSASITQRMIDTANGFIDAIKDAGVKVIKKDRRVFFNLKNAIQDKLNKIVKPSSTAANTLRGKIRKFSQASNDYKKFGGAKDFKKLKNTRATLNQALTETFGQGLIQNEKATKLKILDFLESNKALHDQLSLSFDPERPAGEKIFKRDLSKVSADKLLSGLKMDVDHFKTIKQIASPKGKFSFDDARISETAFNKGLATKYFNTSFKNKIVNYLFSYPDDKSLIKELNTKLKGTGAIISVNDKFVGDKPNPIIKSQLNKLGVAKLFAEKADPELLSGLDTQAEFYKTLGKDIYNLPFKNKKLIERALASDLNIINNEAKKRGFKLNSFAGFLDFAEAGIDLPPVVKQASENILKIGGQTLRGLGRGAVVLDPMFAAVDASEAFRKGASGKQTVDYVTGRFFEGLANLPDLAASGAKFGFDKLRGEDTEFKTGVLYEPRTFAQDYLKRVLEETPEEVKEARKAQLEFDQTVRPGLTMVDDIDIPASKEEIDMAKDLFMKDKGVDLSVLDDIGMQEYTEDYMI
jgi:hypothetical protein